MNILVLGNGFDLAHNLPTRYSDFLQFCSYIVAKINTPNVNKKKEVEKKIFKDFCNENDIFDFDTWFSQNEKEIRILTENNIWLEYFISKYGPYFTNDGTWIDFESEISEVIRKLEEIMTDLDKPTNFSDINNQYFTNLVCNHKFKTNTVREFRDFLVTELKKLKILFEMYLSAFISPLKIKPIRCVQSLIEQISSTNPLYVLSFNYTQTLSKYLEPNYSDIMVVQEVDKLKNKRDNLKFDQIHGTIRSSQQIEIGEISDHFPKSSNNNMVLGFNEYLSQEMIANKTAFIYFRKYYQRILNQTGSDYIDWLNIREGNCTSELVQDHLYFFGHSLDITDGDIIKKLIQSKNMKTTIFYHSDDARATLIVNLVKVIGMENLIRLTGGSNPAISFQLII